MLLTSLLGTQRQEDHWGSLFKQLNLITVSSQPVRVPVSKHGEEWRDCLNRQEVQHPQNDTSGGPLAPYRAHTQGHAHLYMYVYLHTHVHTYMYV